VKTGDAGIGARLALSAILLFGAVVSVVLTRHHENLVYGDATAALSNCPHTETIDCDTVNTSAWSELFGVPIAAFALPTYLLVLMLLWKRPEPSPWLAYAFGIGVLTTLASLGLFYVSERRIGFICLYCVSLYGVNLAIPILSALAARRSPKALLRHVARDLAAWPRPLRVAALTFAALLALTLGAQQSYRVHVRRQAAAEQERIEQQGGPLVPAGPDSSEAPEPEEPAASASLFFSSAEAATSPAAVPAAATPAAPGGPYKLAGPLRRIERGGKSSPFDLQAGLGKGKPVALIFWYPGFRMSERALVSFGESMRRDFPAFDLYAISGKNDESRDEEILETAAMLGVPESLPLLVDDKFTVSNALSTTDVPNLALFDGKGHLVASKIKSFSQTLATPGGNLTAAEVLKRLASGAEFPEIKMMAPYYPATELIGHCAPEFAAKKFDTTEVTKFSGKPQGTRPLLIVFWSSTCKHCQVEMPLMVSWVKRHPGKVDILSVSHIRADKEGRASHREVTRAYLKDQQIPWTVLEDPDDAVAEVYRSISTPTTYFLTPQGMVAEIWFYPHPQNFDKAMDDALGRVATMSSDTCSPAPATPAPRLALDVLTPDGKKVPLSSQLDRPALVHLWATWCAPCMEEIPAILRFGKTLESSGAGRLVMVSVEDAAAADKIAGFAKKFSLPLRSNRAPSGALAQAVDLSYRLPRTYLVARDGTVLALRQGSQKWDDPLVEERALSRLRNAASLAR
jgi:thiol-disulfide isomerase/thioredoxin/uncharacterized membrane protein